MKEENLPQQVFEGTVLMSLTLSCMLMSDVYFKTGKYEISWPSVCSLELFSLTTAKQWEDVLKLGESAPLLQKNRYIWAWPEKTALETIKTIIRELNIEKVLSIGCGSGLLEWILQESIGISSYGIEVDEAWWNSNYSPKCFIKLNFVPDSMDSSFLQACCDTHSWNFAILFCFFNNAKAFHEYLDLYKGKHVIIIGPTPDTGIHTNPAALDPNFPDCRWTLYKWCSISKSEIIAFYTAV